MDKYIALILVGLSLSGCAQPLPAVDGNLKAAQDCRYLTTIKLNKLSSLTHLFAPQCGADIAPAEIEVAFKVDGETVYRDRVAAIYGERIAQRVGTDVTRFELVFSHPHQTLFITEVVIDNRPAYCLEVDPLTYLDSNLLVARCYQQVGMYYVAELTRLEASFNYGDIEGNKAMDKQLRAAYLNQVNRNDR